MSEKFEIKLGVQLDTTNLNEQIKTAGTNANDIPISLDLKKANKQIEELENRLKNLGSTKSKNNSVSFLNTKSLEGSLKYLTDNIKGIKALLTTVDGKSGMKSLLNTVNQINGALESTTKQFENLTKAVSGANFNINFKLGNVNPVAANAMYGDKVRDNTLPQLQERFKQIVNITKDTLKMKGDFDKVAQSIAIGGAGSFVGNKAWTSRFDDGSLKEQMNVWKQLVTYAENYAAKYNVNLSSIETQFKKTTNEMVEDTTKILTGEKQLEEQLKGLFGSGINSERLEEQIDDIVYGLNDINDAIQILSSNDSFDGMAQSFDRLSDTLENLLTNATALKQVFNSGFSNSDSVDTFADTPFNLDSTIDNEVKSLMKDFKAFGVSGTKAFNEIKEAYVNYRNSILSSDSPVDDLSDDFGYFSTSSTKALNNVTDALLKNMKVVNDLESEYKDLYDWIKSYNKGSSKVFLPQTIKEEYGDDFRSMRASLGKNFTATKSGNWISFDSFLQEIEERFPQLVDMSQGMEYAFGDLVDKLNRYKSNSKNKYMTVEQLTSSYISPDELDWIEQQIVSSVNNVNEAEQNAARKAAESANAIVQSEEKKQQAYEQTLSKIEEINRKIAGVEQKRDTEIAGYEDFGREQGFSEEEIKVGIEPVVNAYQDEINDLIQERAKLETQLSSIKTSIQEANNAVKSINVSSGENGFREMSTDIGTLEGKLVTLKSALNSVGFDGASVDSLTNEFKELGITVSSVSSQLDANDDLTLTVKGVNEAKEAVTVVGKLNKECEEGENLSLKIKVDDSKLNSAVKKIRDKLKFNDFDLSGFDVEIQKVKSSFNGLSNQSEGLYQDIQDLKVLLSDVVSADEIGDVQALVDANNEYEESLKRINNQLEIQKNIEKDDKVLTQLNQNRTNLSLTMDNWLKNNSAAAKQFGSRIRELQAELKTCNDVRLNGIRAEFKGIQKEAQLAGKATLTFRDRLKREFAKYSSYLGVSSAFMYIEQGMRDMFEQVVAIDTAMTGLYRVTDLTSSQYETLFSNMIDSAKEYGATLTDIINATSDWVRAGFDADTALGLAEVTTMYQHISDLDYDTASENLITAYNGFKNELLSLYDGDEIAAVGYIADIFNELDNNFAVTSAGLGEALTRSASALDLAGNSIQESAAMVTGITEVTQDPEKAGSALKILSLRLRGMKGQLEELGEPIDENIENISKMQGQILNMTGGKVNIFDDAGNFKSTYEIMDGIAEIWNTLSSIDQADLLETIAGKHRANDVAALLSNWQNVEEAMISATKAEGSAAKENAKYVDSIQGRLDKLKTSWQSFSNTFMSSNFLKTAVSGLTKFVELIEELVGYLGTLGTIGLGAGIFSLFKLKGTGAKVGIIEALSSFVEITPSILSSSDSLGKKFKNIGKEAGNAGKAVAGQLTGSLSGMVGIAGFAVAAVGLIVSAYKNYREEISRARQETIQASNEFLDSASSFEQVYIKYSGKTNLTAEEEKELEDAINGTVAALDDKSSALQGVVDGSNDYVKSLEQIARAELEAANTAAKAKRDAAKNELKDNTSNPLGVSTVNVTLDSDENSKAVEIAKELESDFLGTAIYGNDFKKEEFPEFKLPKNASAEEIVEYYDLLLEYQKRLSDAELGETDVYKDVSEAIGKMSEHINTYVEGVYDATKAEYQLKEGIPKTVDEYLKMRESILADEDVKGLSFDRKQVIASSLESEYKQAFDLTAANVQARKFVGLIKGYGNGSKDGTNEIGTVETFLNMRTAVNNGECSVGEYISQFSDIEEMTKDWTDKEKDEFNLAFGIDTDTVKTQYDEMLKTLSRGMEESEAKKFLDGLSASELTAAFSMKGEVDWENGNPDEILAEIKEKAKQIEAISFSINIDLETEKLENLTSAVTESLSGTGLSTSGMAAVRDMFGSLDSYDPSVLFERTANGIRLNTNEFRRLNDEYKKTNIDGLSKKMNALGDEYNETREELSNLTYGTDEYKTKSRELTDIEDQISALETLQAQYEGLASVYNSWQMAESAGQERDMYEKVIEGFGNVDDELSRGWIDDASIEFIELLTGRTDLATKSAKELKEIYDNLDKNIKYKDKNGKVLEDTGYSVRDFFTVDEDGNSTSQGVHNFLDAIGKLEEEAFGGKDVVKRDENGRVIEFDFQLAGGDEAVAKALGVSKELVQIMKRAADDAGFVVSMDGTYQQLDVLKEKAQNAANELKNTFKVTEHTFNLETTDKKTILGDYGEALKIWEKFKKNKNADGTVNMDVKGAEEAFTLVSTLQSMVDQLNEPVYMKLDATQVEKDIQTPLSKLQEYETLTQTEHQLKLKGTDTSKIEEDKEKILDYFENLDPEIKAQLGIKELTREELEKKIESGEIEIPATVDLQVEMNQSMRDMVNIALYNAGLIDGEELEKRVDISVYAGEVDTTDVDNEVDRVVDESNLDEDKKVTIKAFAEVFGVDDIEELDKKLDSLSDEQIQVLAEVLGKIDVEKLKTTVDGLDNKTVKAIAEALGEGDVEGLKTAIKNIPDEKVAKAIAQAFGYEDVDSLCGAIDKLDPKTVQAIAQALGITDVDSLRGAVNRLTDKDVEVVANTSGESEVNSLKSAIDNVKGKTVTIWASIKKKASDLWDKLTGGSGGVDGTAHVNGTAFAHGTTGRAFKQGDWGTKDSGIALGGEEAPELLVRNGRWHLIGEKGAEFFGYKKGDIIFNGEQTKQIFEKGKITHGNGRGKALASGTAFKDGYVKGGGLLPEVSSSNAGSKSKSSSSKKSSSNSEKDFEESLDWIEIAISRIERAIDNLDKKANNIYKSWSSRNLNLTNEISKVREEINLQEKAYNRYIQEANSVGLSSSWASKVRDGKVDIQTIKDEDLAEKIKNYQNWYEKALKCKDAILELQETESKLYQQKFDNIVSEYDGILAQYDHKKSMLDEYIAQAEESGFIVSTKYYDELIKNQNSTLSKLKAERNDLINSLNSAVNAGKITKNSEAWHEMNNEINDVTLSIEEGETALIEYANAIRQIKWDVFDLVQERISDITEEANFLIELMSNEKLFDDNGQLTNRGMSSVGLYGQIFNTSMNQADRYGDEISALDKEIVEDPYDQELINRRQELLELQRESILAAEDSKNAIRDLVEEGIQLELDALDERIDKYQDALDSQKD